MNAVVEIIAKLSQGNPGAAIFLVEMYKADSLFFGVFVQEMEEIGLKGTQLYTLYNDVCKRDLRKVAKLVSSCPKDLLIEACNKQDRSGYILVDQYLQ